MNPAPSGYLSFFKALRFKEMNMGIILNTKEGAGVNPAPSNYSIIKAIWFNELSKKEGVGVNPAPSNYSTIKTIRFNELIKKEGAG